MLKKSISVNEGLLFVENVESRLNTAIHMLFMNFDIGVVWLNSSKVVVDKTYAKRWRPYYASRFPARYTLEIHPNLLPLFSIGDQITLSFEK